MEETLIKRSMPNSLDAEQSVIGSMIMDKDAILTAMEMLTSDDFYHKQYGILFDAMIELLSLIHISEPTRPAYRSRMPSSA